MDSSSILDIISIAAIFIYGVKGYAKGFIQGLFGLAGVIGGFILALKYGGYIGDILNNTIVHLQNNAIMPLLGSIVILVGTWLFTRILGAIINAFFNSHGLGMTNRLLGFLLGVSKMIFLFSLLIHLLLSIPYFNTSINNTLKNGIMYPYFKTIGSAVIQATPTNLVAKTKTIQNNQ